ncbi:MAG TPA: DUF3761 domain-containing protein [Candidatus Saccharimonadales bacterium]|nr:DUF3761 domain-containing protein [Candidatus Saccharimonadales bacterium]
MKAWSNLKKAVVISVVGIFGLVGIGSLGNSTKNQVNTPITNPSPSAVQGAQTTQQSPIDTTPTPTPIAEPAANSEPLNCPNGTYVNSDGSTVCSPYAAPSAPAGAAARCVDGSYSFSQHRSGTCSHHAGVAEWL